MKLHVRTVILSDVHLGTPDAKVHEVNHFLRHVRCAKLILNGDIIDGWQLTRGGKMDEGGNAFHPDRPQETRGSATPRSFTLRGNHDDVLGRFLPLAFENLRIVEDYVHESPRGRYLVLHGDAFDTVTKNFVWLAHLGDWGYPRAAPAQPDLQRVARMAREGILVAEQGDQGTREGGGETTFSNFEEHIADLGARPRLHGRDVRPHPHPAEPTNGSATIHYPELRRLGRVAHRRSSSTGTGRFELVNFTDFVRHIRWNRSPRKRRSRRWRSNAPARRGT